jgi:Ca-activated chloride channel homolog
MTPPPSYPYPRLLDLLIKNATYRTRLAPLPRYLNYLALALFLIALTNPYLNQVRINPAPLYTEGLAIYLVIDHSGSMQERIETGETKLAFSKKMSEEFVKHRKNDLIGLAAFARSTDVLTPLTLDHEDVLAKLESLTKVPNKDQEGSAIGYAIYKTVNLLAATRHFANEKDGYAIKNSLLVLVTDGLQDPNPLDFGNKLRTMGLEEAAQFAKEQKVRLYIINVEPQMAEAKFAPHRQLFQRITELTGGKFFLAANPNTLHDVYKEINQLEKSPIPENAYLSTKLHLYPYFIGAGMALLLFSLLLDTTWLRRAP